MRRELLAIVRSDSVDPIGAAGDQCVARPSQTAVVGPAWLEGGRSTTRVLACQAVPHADPVPAAFASQASPFPPIGEYAFLSDCHTGALVAPDGSVEWLCLPHFDSPSIFAALLDRGAGTFRIGPYGTFVPAGRRYEPGHEHPRDHVDDAAPAGSSCATR